MPIEQIHYLNNAKLKPEQTMQENYLREIIRQFGINVTYFRHDAAFYETPTSNHLDFTYGEDTTMTFNVKAPTRLFMEVQTDSVLMNRMGIETNSDADCYITIADFTEQFRDMVGKPMFTNVSVHATGEIVNGRGVIRGDIDNGCISGFVEEEINVIFDDGVTGEVVDAPFQRHAKKYNPFTNSSGEYADRVVHGGLSGTWSGILDENGNGTVEAILTGELFYYIGEDVRNGPKWGIAPQVGDFFRLEFDTNSGNNEEYVITQLESRNLQSDGISPLMGSYVWKISVKRRDPSHEIVIGDCEDAQEEEQWTVDKLRVGDLNELMSDEIFDYEDTEINTIDGVKSDNIYGGYGVEYDLKPEPDPGCDMVQGIAYAETLVPSYITGAISSNITFLSDLNLSLNKLAPRVDLADIEIELTEHFVILMEGYIDIPEDGSWTFHMLSADGSLLYINNTLIVDNSGVHNALEVSQTLTLHTGLHKIKVAYNNFESVSALSLSWEHANIIKEIIPSSAFKSEFGCEVKCPDVVDNVIVGPISKLINVPIHELLVMKTQGVGGFFEVSPTFIELSGGYGEDIYYTLDGTEPDLSSDLYTIPFEISVDTVIRSKTFDGIDETCEFTDYVSFGIHDDEKCNMTIRYGDFSGAVMDADIVTGLLDMYSRTHTVFDLVSNRNPSDFEPLPSVMSQLVPNIYYGIGGYNSNDIGVNLTNDIEYDYIIEMVQDILLYSDKIIIHNLCDIITRSGEEVFIEFLNTIVSMGINEILIDEWVPRGAFTSCPEDKIWPHIEGVIIYIDDNLTARLDKISKILDGNEHLKIYSTYNESGTTELNANEVDTAGSSITSMRLGLDQENSTIATVEWVPTWDLRYDPVASSTINWIQSVQCMGLLLFTTTNTTITPIIHVDSGDDIFWEWGDGQSTDLSVINPTYNYTDSLAIHDVSIHTRPEEVSRIFVVAEGITDLYVDDYINMVYLDARANLLNTINVNTLINLESLLVQSNDLTSLNLSGMVSLEGLFTTDNSNLGELVVTDLVNLKTLFCQNNGLTELILTTNLILTTLFARSNNLEELILTTNTLLEVLYCYSNDLDELITTSNTELYFVHCSNNNLTSIDLTTNTKLEELFCYSNNLTDLAIDDIIIKLDGHGLSGGVLSYQANPGSPTFAVCAEYESLISKGWSIAGDNPCLLDFLAVFRTESQGTIDPEISTIDSSLVDWDWRDNTDTIGDNTPSHTYTDGEAFHDVDILNVNPLRVDTFDVSSSNITAVDISEFTNITTLLVGSNNLSSTEIDDIIIQLDVNGLNGGTLDYDNNTGSPTLASLTSHTSLDNKGWTITGNIPS